MAALRPASSAIDLLENPLERYWTGRRYCVFSRSPTLLGFACWGRPDTDDVRELLRACAIGLRPGMTPYRWLVDIRGLEAVEPATFALFAAYTRENGSILGQNILKQAQLRPDGIVGAIVAGFARVARLSYPDRVFTDVGEALEWLDVEHEEGVALLAQIEQIVRESRDGYPVVGRIRRQLSEGEPLKIEAAADRLGMSTRSLQRLLREAGTTYRAEVEAFRIARARDLLRNGERSLTWVALELGFSSVQHFATAFRRAHGETPSVWRSRHRGGP